MTDSTSLTRKTAPQRKAAILRRALGTLALALVGLLAVSQTADAQTRGQRGGGDRTEQQIQQLTTDLDLTDAQAVQVRALFEARKAERSARGERGTSERGSGDREARRAQRDQQRAEMDRQIEALLTPAQVERYQAVKASRQQRGQRGQRGGTR